jgi:isopentenyldiphosphate isomerase
MSETVDIVDERDRVIGRASRGACHGNPSLMHRVVHILVFNPSGDILLQLRGMNKEIQPGKWDTSVGGHMASGEAYDEAARRELHEELCIDAGGGLTHLYDYIWRSEIETERVRTYRLIHDGPYRVQKEEIEEARFFSPAEIEASLGSGVFTPNLEEEWRRYKEK